MLGITPCRHVKSKFSVLRMGYPWIRAKLDRVGDHHNGEPLRGPSSYHLKNSSSSYERHERRYDCAVSHEDS